MIKGEKPVILYENINTVLDLKKIRATKRIWKECDVYPAQLGELFEITNPSLIFSQDFKKKQSEFVARNLEQKGNKLRGNYIYFPWSGLLVHAVNEKDYLLLRTNRNRDIITPGEQKKLQDFPVGIVGLSVGSNIATALVYCGIANTIKFAEFDTLETTNLNRIKARIDQIGIPKIDIVAQQLYEAHPYVDLTFFTEGLTQKTLNDFVLSNPRPKLIYEIMDSFEMKIHLRSLARKHRIPVIMVTNLGDRLLMDVERFDLDPGIEYFNGRAGRVPKDMLEKPDITTADKHKYAVKLAGGYKNIPRRAVDSVWEIGKTLVGRPQLASTVTVSGGIGAYLAKKIALKEKLPSGSWLLDFDKAYSLKSPFIIS